MTVASVDFPDWNPPRDRAAFRTVDTLFGTVAPGDVFNQAYDPVQLDNAVIIQGALPPDTAVHLGTAGIFGPVENLRGAINAGPATVPFLIVAGFAGQTMQVELLNGSATPWGYTLFVDTVAGVQPDLMIPEQLMNIATDLVVPGMADADPVVVGAAGMYTRATVTVQCDQPYTVTIRRSWIEPTPTVSVVSADELVATVASGTDSTTDVAVGANGFAVVVAGTGITLGTASVVVRLYRSGGF